MVGIIIPLVILVVSIWLTLYLYKYFSHKT